MQNKVDFRLRGLLFIVFVGAICQVASFMWLVFFAEMNADWFGKFIHLPVGKTLFRNTFRRVLSMFHPEFPKTRFGP